MSERVVAGRMMTRSLDEFEQACEAWIEAEQGELLPDSAAIDLLCEAVRLSREFADRRRPVPRQAAEADEIGRAIALGDVRLLELSLESRAKLLAGLRSGRPCSRCGRNDVETYGKPGEPLECSLCMQMGRPAGVDRFVTIALQREVFESLECLLTTGGMDRVGTGEATVFDLLGSDLGEEDLRVFRMLVEQVVRAHRRVMEASR